MSSARSNAAARTRRVGSPEFVPQQQQQMNGRPIGQQGQMSAQQLNPKLHFSDAIALLSLRLGRVEQIVQTMPVDQGVSTENDENIRIVDNSVFESMVQRLDTLEKSHKTLSERKPEVIIPPPASTPVVVPSFEVPQHINTSINSLNTDMLQIKKDIIELKDLLLQLQSFTMKTNERLSSYVFTENDNNDQEEFIDGIILSNNVDFDISSEIKETNEELLDLKSQVENELFSSE